MIKKIKKISFKQFNEKNGNLIAYEFKNLKFDIKRIFHVYAKKGQIRGKHAHKNAKQILICSKGKILIKCNDGYNTKKFILQHSTECLYIPEKIWAEQQYLAKENILTVLSTSYFNNNSYIRDFNKYLKDRKLTLDDEYLYVNLSKVVERSKKCKNLSNLYHGLFN